MKLNTINIVAIVLVVLGGLFIWGYAGKGVGAGATTTSADGAYEHELGSATPSVLTASETFYDFGTISMKDGNVTKEFTVTNPTDADVMVSTVLTSCMCTTAFLVSPEGSIKGPFGMSGMGYVPPANELIKAGESRTIRVVYDPNAHGPAGVGQIDRLVALTDSSGGALQLEIKALVTP